jgi:dihydrofolate reductase
VAPRDLWLTIIAAVSENGVIGANGDLPWRLPDDLKRFKRLTQGGAVIMGRATFESIGKPLPGRRNVVLTRREEWRAAGVETAHTLDEALALVEPAGHAFVGGGGDVYRLTMPLASAIELTRVHATINGDTTFPAIDARAWRCVAEEHHPTDELHALAFTFERWERVV